jgi:hypothetical protein
MEAVFGHSISFAWIRHSRLTMFQMKLGFVKHVEQQE